ncbi:hypothetical protein ASPZODRAFT_61864 [Penicilliopsis zonata CBS 506.65]|uniref:Peptidase S9 prolyl oligopeptidase catalytic domain-containing protein n=1 Tax=Penicilliopsis zonata CBS 506.65 TaxID=1073090 RepID=A0A1L9SLL7_9EURO|nr:hypothetical protein ASPZODRAFT_61864 [Penicilliopsis zonata CBS 506.65]OJJ48115.1 hypothetical protein ASPZODRAFT_61864 [Penicilliopsis zonata CBS 506.65]
MPLCVQYKEINGTRLTADIYLPSSQGKRPVLINIHGGAFMLGSSKMVSLPQIEDCLSRDWIVVVPNHRLCPAVNILEGPISDCRDLLAWIYDGHLDEFLRVQSEGSDGSTLVSCDLDKVMAFGTSSGGTLALALCFDVPRTPAAILNFYAPVNFSHPFWTSPLPHVAARLPGTLTEQFMKKVYDEFPVPSGGETSLEGQSVGPDFSRPRDAFAFTAIANGSVIDRCYPPPLDRTLIDPLVRVADGSFPPTYIVHGEADTMVPPELSRGLFATLKENGVRCGMTEVPGEEHTFAMRMVKGSATWQLQRQGFDFLEEIISGGNSTL